jgi:adenylate cyclase
LLASDNWRSAVYKTLHIKQAYLCNTDKASLRVRTSNEKAYISSKTMTRDIRRHEFEYPIPLHDAEFMIEFMCQGSAIIKSRHLIKVGQHVWEIDEFFGDNRGLIVAEIELTHENEDFLRPEWLGDEVSSDVRYFNMMLINNPFNNWTT